MARKTKRYWTRHKRLLWLVILFVLVILAVGMYMQLHKSTTPSSAIGSNPIRPENSVDNSPSKVGDNTANNQRKGSSTPASTITQSTPGSNGGSTQPTISIDGANPSGQSITVSATATNAMSGICTFSFSKSDGGPVVKSYPENVQYTGTYYSCPLHSVPMPSTGNWYVSVVLSSEGQTATDKWPAPVNL